MSGWVKLHRSIWDHPFFDAEPMSEREAFLWLVSKAAHAATRHRTQAGMAEVPRGSLFVTLRGLATEWRWKSEKRVRTFLARLEKEGMIGRSADAAREHNKTQITICNYDKFQECGRSADAAETQDGRSADALNKNDKKKEERKNPPTPRKRGGADDADFAKFWAAYPRKVAKPAAFRAWRAAIKRDDPQTIIAAAPNAGDGGQFTPHPSTWLNQDRWKDGAKRPSDAGYYSSLGIPDLDGGSDEPRGNFSSRQARHSAGANHPNDLSGLFPHSAQEARPVHVSELLQ